MKIAQVIVDIPLKQTDKLFSYLVPEVFCQQIQLGSRVHVPFGRGNRLLQGFVVGFLEASGQDLDGLKAIEAVLDFEPVLNEEQLFLADQMRHTVFSYKISILKAMLPNLLNSHYDKRLMPMDTLGEADRLALFGQDESRLYSSLSQDEIKLVSQLVHNGKLSVTYLAKDKKSIKTEKTAPITERLTQYI